MRVLAVVQPRARLAAVVAAARGMGCDVILRAGRAYLVRRVTPEAKEKGNGQTDR
ncbi:hypothetical protein HC341_02180 [Aquisalimonas sp. 2447]|uniref:hypothetical protein n=1 Tax=Aquisalimonas sp. 2447 TaxID=2740807 RepID=UPI0014325DB7|nr:hypothetical protein [Aquisalimonas sp. 2447]QIT54128.1 hypothetical protein HC341_02180 [Aquisalimonas sp. 2447]